MSDKGKNILSYLIPICGIVFMLMKENSREVRFIGAQATTLWIIFLLINMLLMLLPNILMLDTILNILYIVVMIIGIVRVCNEKDLELPILGQITKSIFGKLIEE